MSSFLHPWRTWCEAVADRLSDHGYPVLAADIVVPPKPELGDLAIPFFRLAKERGQSPADLARDAGQVLLASEEGNSNEHIIVEAVAAGPYLNVRLSTRVLLEPLHAMLKQESGAYGRLVSPDVREVVFEYANPNTHKEIHIGHVRNFVTGVAYHGVWKAAGINVKAIQFVNDQGANVAKTLWVLVKKAGKEVRSINDETVESILTGWPENQKTGNALADLYVEATRKLEEDETQAADVSFIQARLEAHDAAWERLWRVTRDWCLNELKEICTEMGIVFDRVEPYLESAFLDEAANIVHRLERDKVAKISDGALVVDLEEEKLGTCLLRKSDGNLLYLSKDLALAEQKARDYPEVAAQYVLTDDRQTLHFKQVQSVLQKMGHKQPYAHLGYGLLTLKEGAMSSRKGNVITYQWLRDELIRTATEQIRERHTDWAETQIQETARVIAFGGMKFALLKQDPASVMVFDREQALAFEGMTGPYCQYAVVRLRSILEKAGTIDSADLTSEISLEPAERALVLAIAQLPSVIEKSAGVQGTSFDLKKTQPALLAQWCFAIAQLVNAFYRDVPVLNAEPSARSQRLMIARAAERALVNGLQTLTIDVPRAM